METFSVVFPDYYGDGCAGRVFATPNSFRLALCSFSSLCYTSICVHIYCIQLSQFSGIQSDTLPPVKDLRKAFRKRSLAMIPDKHPTVPNAHSRFEEVNNSFVTVIFASNRILD